MPAVDPVIFRLIADAKAYRAELNNSVRLTDSRRGAMEAVEAHSAANVRQAKDRPEPASDEFRALMRRGFGRVSGPRDPIYQSVAVAGDRLRRNNGSVVHQPRSLPNSQGMVAAFLPAIRRVWRDGSVWSGLAK